MAQHFSHHDFRDSFLCPGQAPVLLLKIPSQGVIKLDRICSLSRAQPSSGDQSLSDKKLVHGSGRNQTHGINVTTVTSHQLPIKDHQCRRRWTNSVNCNECPEQVTQNMVTLLWLSKSTPSLYQKLQSLNYTCSQIKLDKSTRQPEQLREILWCAQLKQTIKFSGIL